MLSKFLKLDDEDPEEPVVDPVTGEVIEKKKNPDEEEEEEEDEEEKDEEI